MAITLQEIKNIVALKDQSEELLQWILDNSVYHEYEDGYAIRKVRDPQDEMFFLLEGVVNFYMDMNGRQVY